MTADGIGDNLALPEHLVAMVKRMPPASTPVVPQTTPVVAFGNPELAAVATLGINPSASEFLKDGKLLSGQHRRLATLASLNAHRLDLLDDAQVATVIAECAAYFQRRPYRRWFNPLNQLLRISTTTSYYDGTACHLDLVQWATDPVWRRIANKQVRRLLLDEGLPHLRALLGRDNVQLVLLNGRQVINEVEGAGLVTLCEVGTILMGRVGCLLYEGLDQHVRWIGWSTNLQSSFGVSSSFKQELADWIAAAISR